ncbi:MAG: hypothetical protein Q9188_006852, partial [Gyalolechia gomerana]
LLPSSDPTEVLLDCALPGSIGWEKTQVLVFPLVKVWKPLFLMWLAVQAFSIGVSVGAVKVDEVVETEVVIAVEDLAVEVVKVVEVCVFKQEHPADSLDAK